MHALRSLAELITVYALSPIDFSRDAMEVGPLKGFTQQPTEGAQQELTSDVELGDDG